MWIAFKNIESVDKAEDEKVSQYSICFTFFRENAEEFSNEQFQLLIVLVKVPQL